MVDLVVGATTGIGLVAGGATTGAGAGAAMTGVVLVVLMDMVSSGLAEKTISELVGVIDEVALSCEAVCLLSLSLESTK